VPVACGLEESTAADGSNAQAVHARGERGEGISIGIISIYNVLATHEAFEDANGNSRVENIDVGAGFNFSNEHDTCVAGILASRGGADHPNDIGAAPDANVCSVRIDDFADIANALYILTGDEHKCRIIVSPIETTSEPNGQSQFTQLYDYYAYEHDVIFANASGNTGTYITVFGDSYNGITTGGLILNDPNNQYLYRKVGSTSNIGPTDDGRRKPDIVAPSESQTVPTNSGDTDWTTIGNSNGWTSFAIPHTAGVAALLLGLADDTTDANDNQNEVIKAVIVNSTFPNIDDCSGNWTNPADPNNTWNPHRGYGRVDALRAYELLDSNQITPDTDIIAQKGWAFGTIEPNGNPNDVYTYKIYAVTGQRILVTLTWDRRIEWIDTWPPYSKINYGELHSYPPADLDLVVYEPNEANVIFSQTLFSLDPDDNLEKCDLLLQKEGYYLVRVVNKSTTEIVDFGLAFEVLSPIPGDFDPVDYIVDYADMSVLAQQWLLDEPGLEANLVGGDIVNFPDFAEFANHWLETDPAYRQQ
jgi:hypothetical protein